MKFFLTLYICSVVGNNQCMEVPQDKHTYKNVHDTHASCVKDGLGESFEVLFNGELFKEKDINEYKFYPKFMCVPFESEDAPEAAPSEAT